MKTAAVLASFLAAASTVSAHSTWQELWVDGVDEVGTCVRLPPSNSPVTDVTSTDIRCNVDGSVGISGICEVEAGGTVTVEMHAQPGDRSCDNEAIGGNHDGPVIVYMSKVSDATTDVGDGEWFKIYQDGLVSTDYWGTDVLNANCGKQDVVIPADLEPGDYLLRAEVIALHVASSVGGAQFYISCYQIRVTGTGTAAPGGVSFPGAYSATDPGILFNLYTTYTTYIVPGPDVYTAGGSLTPTTSSASTAASATGSSTPGTLAQWAQCGGNGFTSTDTCASGYTCVVLNDYYSQCQ
ncbi:hypothetical protein RUND412_001693 [Rhizina undulata]